MNTPRLIGCAFILLLVGLVISSSWRERPAPGNILAVATTASVPESRIAAPPISEPDASSAVQTDEITNIDFDEHDPKDPETIRIALEALGSKNLVVRRRAVWDLRMIGAGHEEAVEPLLKTIEDSDGPVRYYSMQALGQIASARAVPKIIEKLQSQDWMMRAYAVRALKHAGPLAAAAVPQLSKVALNETPALAYAAAKTLKAIGTTDALRIVNDPQVQRALHSFDQG